MRSRFTYVPEPTPRAAPSRPAQAFGFVFLLVGTLVFAQTIATRFGFEYLPSRDWITLSKPAAQTVGMVFGALTFFAFWHLIRINRENNEAFTITRTLFLLIAGPVMFYFIMVEAVVTSGPMVIAALKGKEVTHDFIVRGIKTTNDDDCRHRIALEDMPILTKELCGYPIAVVSMFAAGDMLNATGRGTAMGLFPARIARAQ